MNVLKENPSIKPYLLAYDGKQMQCQTIMENMPAKEENGTTSGEILFATHLTKDTT